MFTLKKEADQIYSLCFKDPYKLAMVFLRYQEFYESDNPRFYRNKFTLMQYIDWYVQKFGAFTYHKDWIGFNIPLSIIDQVHGLGISDENHNDLLMMGLSKMIKSDANNDNCYLIGYSKGKKDTLKHEVAHARFYINGDYRIKIENTFSKLPIETQNKLYKAMLDMGYAQSSAVDEFQAYASENNEKRFWKEEMTPELQEFFDSLRKIYAESFPIFS